MIRAHGIKVTFNQGTPLENPVLRGLDLSIPEGQFVTVIGSNGAGKSTLLNVLAGEVLPDTGQVLIDEREVTRWPTARRAGMVARVFQDPLAGTCGDLTIEENLALAAGRGNRRGLRPAVKKALQERFHDDLASLNLGLERRLRDHVSLLSGGQRQALSLLMATLRPMKILLLDEHTAALDPKTAGFVLELTANVINQQRLTALMVTHSMRQALDVGQRTIMMDQGRIAFDVAGAERAKLDVPDLLRLFEKSRGAELADDKLLFG